MRITPDEFETRLKTAADSGKLVLNDCGITAEDLGTIVSRILAINAYE